MKAARFYNDALKDGHIAGPNADEVVKILTEYSFIKDPAVHRAIISQAVDPDGKLVFISSLSGSGLAILDSATHKEVKRIDIRSAAGIQMEPNGSHAYVACTGESYVAVVDLKILKITGRINAGPEPDGLAWSVR